MKVGNKVNKVIKFATCESCHISKLLFFFKSNGFFSIF